MPLKTPTPTSSSTSVFIHEVTKTRVEEGRRARHAGKIFDAITALEDALQIEGDNETIWGELALTQYQAWHDIVTVVHKQGVLNMKLSGWSDASDGQGHPVGGSALQGAYNTFIIAMEYPVNKKNPQLLIEMIMLYIEYQAYRGALSVCTLLIEGYPQSSLLQEAVFLSAVSAKALGKRKESAQYFAYLVEKPPFRLPGYQLHLLAALELENVEGMRDHARESYVEAYKLMIKLSPMTLSEKAAHDMYKTSHKNESQRVQMWFQDDRTWLELATKLAKLNFPLLVCSVLGVTRRRNVVIPHEILILEGISLYRLGDTEKAVSTLSQALQEDYWSDHVRLLLRKTSSAWCSQFDIETMNASRIQVTVRRHRLRKGWRALARRLLDEKRRMAATAIQCAWRQRASRQKLCRLKAARREKERNENCTMSTEDWLLIMQLLNAAATRIQSLHKIFRAKQEVHLQRVLNANYDRVVATFAIHRAANSSKVMLRVWRTFVNLQKEERYGAACTIQRQVRCFLSRTLYKRLLQARARQQMIVAICLDRRGNTLKRRMMIEWCEFVKRRRESKRRAAARIQNAWRCHVGHKRYRHELRRHLVATELMHRLLGEKRQKRLRDVWNAVAANAMWHRLRKRRSAIVIQRHARGMITRRRVRKLRSRRRRVEVVLNAIRAKSIKQQLALVLGSFVRFVEMQWETREQCAVLIQKIYRGYADRKRVRFLRETNRILQEPGMTLRGKPHAYVLRVCFLLLARLPEQNKMDQEDAILTLQRWYRHARKRRRLVRTLQKLRRQRAVLNTLQATFHSIARLFFFELKSRMRARRWRQDRMARRIQRAAKKWLTYRRYQRVLDRRASRKARAREHARQKQLALRAKCLVEWHRVVCSEREEQIAAVRRIQRAYRARAAKKQAQQVLYKREARARLVDSIHLKPLERCFRQWEASLIEKSVLTVRSASRASSSSRSPDKWRLAMKTPQMQAAPPSLTLEERAVLPSVLFYTLLNRVRKTGILQLSFAGGLSCLPTSQLQQLLAYASSVIVDGGGVASGLVEQVVEAMGSSARVGPAQKLIFYNARLSAAHAAVLRQVLRHPESSVTSLVLSNVPLCTGAVVALATALCYGHSRLEQLVLEACGVGSVGAAALAEGLCHSRSLWKLDLSRNRVGDGAAAALAHALVAAAPLRVLALGSNALSDRGVLSHLAPALQHAAAGMGVQAVVLRHNQRISPWARHALEEATSRLPGLLHLESSCSGIGY